MIVLWILVAAAIGIYALRRAWNYNVRKPRSMWKDHKHHEDHY